MGALSPLHLVLILVIALVVLGPGRLPEAGSAIGKAVRGFRDAVDGSDKDSQAGTPAPSESPTKDDAES